MKVYISASTERTENNRALYSTILKLLDDLDIANNNSYFAAIVQEKKKIPLPNFLYETTLKRINNSDLLIVDISQPSVSIGILIEFAQNNNVPILCICEESYRMNIPRILTHRKKSNLFTLLVFNKDDIQQQLNIFFDSFRRNKVKFNVFISPEIDSYMKSVVKKRKYSSKSDFFRDLIETHMKNDVDYSQ